MQTITVIAWLLLGLMVGATVIWIGKKSPLPEKQVWANSLVVAGLIYVGFALPTLTNPDISTHWLLIELIGLGIYGGLAYLGHRSTAKWLALGWLFHPLWDMGLHYTGVGAHFVPTWYVVACISCDLLIGLYIGGVVWLKK